MIYTLTVNPALDYTMEIHGLTRGAVNRAQTARITPGGKGINVSIVLKNLEIENRILGFIAGFTGLEIENSLNSLGHSSDFVKLSGGLTRVNVKLLDNDTTDLNAPGPEIDSAALNELYAKLDRLQDGDILVLSGAVPSSLPDYSYALIMERLAGKKVRSCVDASGSQLLKSLPCHPFLIKPNIDELNGLFSINISSRAEVIKYALKLKEMGAENVLVSLGAEGAVLAGSDGHIYEAFAPSGIPMSTVGAGDSMIAGFLYGYLKASDSEKLSEGLRFGIGAGSATVFSNHLAYKDDILALANRTKVSMAQ